MSFAMLVTLQKKQGQPLQLAPAKILMQNPRREKSMQNKQLTVIQASKPRSQDQYKKQHSDCSDDSRDVNLHRGFFDRKLKHSFYFRSVTRHRPKRFVTIMEVDEITLSLTSNRVGSVVYSHRYPSFLHKEGVPVACFHTPMPRKYFNSDRQYHIKRFSTQRVNSPAQGKGK